MGFNQFQPVSTCTALPWSSAAPNASMRRGVAAQVEFESIV
jgi:hypothetical protein